MAKQLVTRLCKIIREFVQSGRWSIAIAIRSVSESLGRNSSFLMDADIWDSPEGAVLRSLTAPRTLEWQYAIDSLWEATDAHENLQHASDDSPWVVVWERWGGPKSLSCTAVCRVPRELERLWEHTVASPEYDGWGIGEMKLPVHGPAAAASLSGSIALLSQCPVYDKQSGLTHSAAVTSPPPTMISPAWHPSASPPTDGMGADGDPLAAPLGGGLAGLVPPLARVGGGEASLFGSGSSPPLGMSETNQRMGLNTRVSTAAEALFELSELLEWGDDHSNVRLSIRAPLAVRERSGLPWQAEPEKQRCVLTARVQETIHGDLDMFVHIPPAIPDTPVLHKHKDLPAPFRLPLQLTRNDPLPTYLAFMDALADLPL